MIQFSWKIKEKHILNWQEYCQIWLSSYIKINQNWQIERRDDKYQREIKSSNKIINNKKKIVNLSLISSSYIM